MQHAIIVRGRLSGARRIELAETVDGLDGEVEVVIRPLRSEPEAADLGAVVHALPMGALTKDEIDQELARDRAEIHLATAVVAKADQFVTGDADLARCTVVPVWVIAFS